MVRALTSVVLLASALGLSVAASQLERRLDGVVTENENEDYALFDGDLPQDDLDLPDVVDDSDDFFVRNSTEIDYDEAEDNANDYANDVDDEPGAPLGARATKAKVKVKYKLKDRIVSGGFFKAFNFDTFDDPTQGRVDYVSMVEAQKLKLAVASKDKIVLRADAKNKVLSGQRGRKSVRISSKKAYTTHVIVMAARHMPQGPGTWPAFWEFGEDWPNNGELDIVEGANDVGPSLSSLHTSPNCTQPAKGRKMKGRAATLDCNALAPGNVGCGVTASDGRSFGPSFNKNGGGFWAAERTTKYIKVWFWSKKDSSVPKEVRDDWRSINPDNWGTPQAVFVSDSCAIGSKFGPNNIVINLTFCGAWAGNTFPGGMDKCVETVNNNPGAFKDAYWDIARINVYA